jgi:hypothetical protein
MTALGQHICIRWSDDRVIAPGDRERRIVARAVLRIAEDLPLLGFGLADTHLHAQSLGDERLASEIARRVGISLHRRLRLPVGFHVLPPRPILDLWHLTRCFRYVHTQAAHHGVSWERWFEATSLPDLLGLRPLGGFLAVRMREHLPRLKSAELLSWLGVARLDPPGEATPHEIVEAALASVALPSFDGRSRELTAMRRAVMERVGGRVSREELARLLGINVRTVTRLRALAPDPALIRVIGHNLALRQALREQEIMHQVAW